MQPHLSFAPSEMEIDHGETEVTTMRSAFWTSLRFANQAEAGRPVPLASIELTCVSFLTPPLRYSEQ
ncbi:MAG: hypothetical protein DHS20C11_18990 [Lysobacteraceae bacterium]|nr:MAG: hypothetical protein DHS20C11_18990 [Xanthomonadaceae bacterium]